MKPVTLPLALALATVASPVGAVQRCDGRFVDTARNNRAVQVRVRLPDGSTRVPVILFSHGLGGSLVAGTHWAEAWSKAGFAVVNVQHPGSDASLLNGETGAAAMRALRKGATPQQLLARVVDMRFVVDSIGRGGAVGQCSLARLDLTRLGVAGHSMGAQTVQAVAGQTFPLPAGRRGFGDPRVVAALAFSPAPPARGDIGAAFSQVRIPFFSITGTEDAVPGLTAVSPADRQRPFAAMPSGDKYLLVLNRADHMVFAGGEERRAQTASDLRVSAIVIDTTTNFWRRYLLRDATIRVAPTLPEKGDNFTSK